MMFIDKLVVRGRSMRWRLVKLVSHVVWAGNTGNHIVSNDRMVSTTDHGRRGFYIAITLAHKMVILSIA
jgi:hypothetical protein